MVEEVFSYLGEFLWKLYLVFGSFGFSSSSQCERRFGRFGRFGSKPGQDKLIATILLKECPENIHWDLGIWKVGPYTSCKYLPELLTTIIAVLTSTSHPYHFHQRCSCVCKLFYSLEMYSEECRLFSRMCFEAARSKNVFGNADICLFLRSETSQITHFFRQLSKFWKICWCKRFDKYHVCASGPKSVDKLMPALCYKSKNEENG